MQVGRVQVGGKMELSIGTRLVVAISFQVSWCAVNVTGGSTSSVERIGTCDMDVWGMCKGDFRIFPECHQLLFAIKAVLPSPELATSRGDPEIKTVPIRETICLRTRL
jgi:hypothetical protein